MITNEDFKNIKGFAIKDFDEIVSVISTTKDKTFIRDVVKRYGDIREEKGINEGWHKSRVLYNKSMRLRSERLKKLVIEYNEYTSMIEIPEFIKFVSAMEDEMKAIMRGGTDDARKAAENLFDFMHNKIGNINLDRRRILPLLGNDD